MGQEHSLQATQPLDLVLPARAELQSWPNTVESGKAIAGPLRNRHAGPVQQEDVKFPVLG